MRASPFIKALESEAQAWEVLMVRLQDIVDNWLTCQVRSPGQGSGAQGGAKKLGHR